VAVLVVARSGSKPEQRDNGAKTSSPAIVRPVTKAPDLRPQPQTLRAGPQVVKAQPAIPATLGAFGSWAEKIGKAATEQERGSLLAEGEALAKARREELKKLMQS